MQAKAHGGQQGGHTHAAARGTHQGREQRLVLKERLQAGAQGEVYRGMMHSHVVAVKKFKNSTAAPVHAELQAFERLRWHHPHVLGTYQPVKVRHSSGSTSVLLPMEFAERDMFEHMSKVGPMGMTSRSLREWGLQVAHALAFCHVNGIAHRDVKPENILLVRFTGEASLDSARSSLASTESEQHSARTAGSQGSALLVAKLCDFGSAKVGRCPHGGVTAAYAAAPPARLSATSPCGSPLYAAPEVAKLSHKVQAPPTMISGVSSGGSAVPGANAAALHSSNGQASQHAAAYDPCAADVWSFAIMLHVMATGKALWHSAVMSDDRFAAFAAQQMADAAPLAIALPRDSDGDVRLGGGAFPSSGASGTSSMASALPQAPTGSVGTTGSSSSGRVWRWSSAMPPSLQDLMDRCLVLDPAARPTMGQLLEHPWFSEPGWSPLTHPERVAGMGGRPRRTKAFLPAILPPAQGGGWHAAAPTAAAAASTLHGGTIRADSDDL